jgi:glyoxylase-like metal-dependent hydrolase (beta-lactamase superfamily II)
MRRKTLIAIALLVGLVAAPGAQSPALKAAGDALGGIPRSIEFSGSGLNFALGQSPAPGAPWPKFNVKSYTAAIDYATGSMRVEMVRTQGENPPRGGGQQPLVGEQRQVQFVSGSDAWNMAGQNAAPAPATAVERKLQIWITPHGFLKAAVANNATVQSRGGRTQVAFTVDGKHKVNGTISANNQVERVQTWIDNPVLGDMLVESIYSDYRTFDGISFPGRIVQNQGGFPVLDLTIASVRPNAAVDISTPANVRAAAAPPVRVDVQKIGEGIYHLTGGSHNSVALEMKDHVVMIEGPQNEERSLAVIAKTKETIPNKPIKFLVNTHHHFDHSGGIRTYAAEGATIVTHQMNRPFYEKVWAAPRTLNPDRLAQSRKKATFVTFGDKHVMTDGSRTIELHLIKGSGHNDAIVMAYLPNEKLLIEADAFNPPSPDTPPPSPPSPYTVNLYDNIRRLNLDVVQIAPLHGRMVTMADLTRFAGRTSN